ncbi:hypothetical protein ACRC7T_18375, partial [Segnochrobactraceae bacterium EtOH-i3]
TNQPAVGSSVAAVGVSGGIRAPTQAVNTDPPDPKRNSPPNLIPDEEPKLSQIVSTQTRTPLF